MNKLEMERIEFLNAVEELIESVKESMYNQESGPVTVSFKGKYFKLFNDGSIVFTISSAVTGRYDVEYTYFMRGISSHIDQLISTVREVRTELISLRLDRNIWHIALDTTYQMLSTMKRCIELTRY